MFVGCLGILIVASNFVTEVPELIRAKLESTNEVSGTFVQTKIDPSGAKFVSRGVFKIRPGVDFRWETKAPFETVFYATPTNYVYSNEDESVTRLLRELPGVPKSIISPKPDLQAFFKVFDAQYKEEGGKFFLKAKPRIGEIAKFLERIEAEGSPEEGSFEATFPNRVRLRLDLHDSSRKNLAF